MTSKPVSIILTILHLASAILIFIGWAFFFRSPDPPLPYGISPLCMAGISLLCIVGGLILYGIVYTWVTFSPGKTFYSWDLLDLTGFKYRQPKSVLWPQIISKMTGMLALILLFIALIIDPLFHQAIGWNTCAVGVTFAVTAAIFWEIAYHIHEGWCATVADLEKQRIKEQSVSAQPK